MTLDFTTATPSQVDEARNTAMLEQRDALYRVATTVITYNEAHKTRKGVDYAAGAARKGMTADDVLARAERMLNEFDAALTAKREQVAADGKTWVPDSVRFTPSDWEAVSGARPSDFSTRRAEALRTAIDAARDAADTIAAADAEYDRRGGWARYWIVTSSSHGKVHHYGCGSWRWTTQVALAFEVSGEEDEGVVATLDAGACTRCFPDAPTEWTPAPVETAAEKATRVIHGDGYAPRNADTITCTDCGQTLPGSKFPTAKGGTARKTECRTCRDARYAENREG